MVKPGILVLNFGGPSSLKEVPGFLYRLFVDPAVLGSVKPPMRQALAFFIAALKSGSSKKMYASIGGGSPQLKWTIAQVEGLKTQFGNQRDLVIEFGMRLSNPSIEDGLKKLRNQGVQRIILLPLFSQYSFTTTASCFDEVKAALKRMRWSPPMSEISEWCDQVDYIALLKETIEEQIAAAKAETGEDPHVLFSAHSLPMKIVNQGDPYLGHVSRTVVAVSKGLNCPWSLAFQSRNGPIPWAKPYVEEEIPKLAQSGVKNLVVVPLSFVCDHVETLFELDQVYAGLAKDAGITGYYRARTFNDDPKFPVVLKTIVENSGWL